MEAYAKMLSRSSFLYIKFYTLGVGFSYSNRSSILHAAQAFPEYFGALPVPMNTSRGFTVRHWILDNGIYWIETDQCEEVLAIGYPVWSSELSDPVVKLGERTECDIENTMGYLFYPMQTSCIPLRELMEMRPAWEGTMINKPALMNAICKAAPKYAILINQREQLGKNDGISVLLAEFGMETKPHTAHDFLIRIFPEAGEAFLLLEGRQCNTVCGGIEHER